MPVVMDRREMILGLAAGTLMRGRASGFILAATGGAAMSLGGPVNDTAPPPDPNLTPYEANFGTPGDDGANAVTADANTHYIDAANGDDSAGDGSAAAPWRTLSQLEGVDLGFGPTILLARGAVYDGPLPALTYTASAADPLVIAPYGAGKPPVISGSVTVTGWTDEGNGSFSALVSDRVHAVFVNGIKLTLARTPTLYHKAKTAQPKRDLIVGDLPPITGGVGEMQAVVRDAAWNDSTRQVSSYNAATGAISLARNLAFNKYKVGYGLHLQNHKSFLTEPGEWFHDTGKNKLYVIPPAGVTLSTATVRASVRPTALRLAGADIHLLVDRVRFEQFGAEAIDIDGASSDITINRCAFEDCDSGIKFKQGRRPAPGRLPPHTARITNCTFRRITEYSIQLRNVQKMLIQNTEHDDIGQVGINSIDCEAITMHRNALRNIGRSAITMGGPYQHMWLRWNLVDRFCFYYDDQGGIYTWDNHPNKKKPGKARAAGGMNYVERNLIRECFGNRDLAGGGTSKVTTGIYLDDNSENWRITDNVVVDGGARSIDCHNAREIRIQNMISTNADIGLFINESHQVYKWAGRNINNIDVIDCVFLNGMEPSFRKSDSRWLEDDVATQYMSPYGSVADFFRATSGNFYASKETDAAIYLEDTSGEHALTADQWRARYGGEVGSVTASGYWRVIENDSLTQSLVVKLGPAYTLTNGSPAPATVTLAPLSAVVVRPR